MLFCGDIFLCHSKTHSFNAPDHVTFNLTDWSSVFTIAFSCVAAR